MQDTQENSDTKCSEENLDCGETEEAAEDVKRNEEETSDEETSPRGVLEIPISSSETDNSSTSSSFGSLSFNEKLEEQEQEQEQQVVSAEVAQGLQWKNLISKIKRRSVRRLSVIPLWSISGSDISKSLRKRLGRNRTAEHEIDCGDLMVPKPSWRNFSLQELAAATHDFSPDNLIGEGGHAKVYKGCLPDGQIVAVKRITKEQKSDEDRVGDFLTELGIIAHINHPNTAKLIGFGIDGGLHLVLQFLPHGSLATILHGSNDSPEWKIRFKVVNGVAEGLRYLHCECQRRIIHRDITASNILLTEDYEPQISDFGLAKWLPEKWVQHVVSPIEGTFGYMAPEYFMHGIVDEKTDVFAFGVLLLELITGRHAVNSFRQSLVMWAKPLLEKNDVKELVDPRLQDAYDSIEMKRAMLAASVCLHHVPSMRPNMTRVVNILKGEGGAGLEMKHKSMGPRAIMLEACDLEDYTSTTYLKDLNRHMQLVME